jgi:hypothetical protein
MLIVKSTPTFNEVIDLALAVFDDQEGMPK